mgnify:FL=1
MLFNTSYTNEDYTKEIKNILGEAFSFLLKKD